MKHWQWMLLITLALAIIGGAGYLGFNNAPAKPAATPQAPSTLTVERGDVRQTISAPGQLASTQDVMLEMPVGGRLERVNVRPGDAVQAGQTLAQVETLPLYNAVRDASAELEQARFKLQKAQRAQEAGTDLAAAGKGVEAARWTVVNAQGSYSSTLLRSDVSADVREAKAQADYWADVLGDAWLRLDEKPQSEKRRLEYEVAGAQSARAHNDWLRIQQDAKNQISSAQRNIAAAQQAYLDALAGYNALKNGDPVREAELQVLVLENKLMKAQADLEAAKLVAPFDGVVLQVKAGVGETAAAGAGLVRMTNPAALEASVTVIEEDYALLQPGQLVELYFDAHPDAPGKGRVGRIVPQRAAGDRPLYPVYITLDDMLQGFAPGMTVDASIIVGERSNVLRLPRALVRARSDGTANVQVWANGQIEERTIKTGLRGDQYVEILEGLREGEQVVGE